MSEIAFVWSGKINPAEDRKRLSHLIESLELKQNWDEWLLEDPSLPGKFNKGCSSALYINGYFGGDFGTSSDQTLLKAAKKLLRKKTINWKAADLTYFLGSIVLAFFPKCPFCWLAYASFFSSIGLGEISYRSWYFPIILAIYILGSGYIYVKVRLSLFLKLGILSGTLITACNAVWFQNSYLKWCGLALVLLSGIYAGLPNDFKKTLRYFFSGRRKRQIFSEC